MARKKLNYEWAVRKIYEISSHLGVDTPEIIFDDYASPIELAYSIHEDTLFFPTVLLKDVFKENKEEKIGACIAHELVHHGDKHVLRTASTAMDHVNLLSEQGAEAIKRGERESGRALLKDADFLAQHIIGILNQAEVRAVRKEADMYGLPIVIGAYADMLRYVTKRENLKSEADDVALVRKAEAIMYAKPQKRPSMRADKADINISDVIRCVAQEIGIESPL